MTFYTNKDDYDGIATVGSAAYRRMDILSIDGDTDSSLDGGDEDYRANVHASVARNTASGLELLLVYLEAEIRRLRYFLRDCGVRIRRFCTESLRVDFHRIIEMFLRLTESRVKPAEHVDVEGMSKDEAMIFNEVPLRPRWRPPKFTFNDVAIVLTTDEEVEDGVVHAYTIRSPAWTSLPSPIASRHSESELRDFQLFNRPMKMAIPTDDEDDRISLPSTMAMDQELKIQSLEAQLALLSKQMQQLLAGKVPPVNQQNTGSCESSPAVSEDEGKGLSMCSLPGAATPTIPRTTPAGSTPARICPSNIPPPPPPPPPSLFSSKATSTSEKLNTPNRTVLQMLNKSSNVEHEVLPVRPTASDLRMVQLKKTNTARSPGGTPVDRQSRLSSNDQGNYLANALREKFRSIQESISEHEDDVNTSWAEDDS